MQRYNIIKNKLQNLFRKSYYFISAFFMLVSFFSFSFAQTSGPAFEIVPNNYNFSAGDVVFFNLESFKVETKKSNINWILNGKSILSGFGKDSIKITVPERESSLAVRLTTPEGEVYDNDFRLYNKSVIIYWEATDSYVPDWYRGKRMLVKGGTARVHAFSNITTNGVKISDNDLLYTWEINGKIQQDESGLGKNFLDIYASEVEGTSMEIKVTVTPRLSNDETVAVENIEMVDTRAVFYLKGGNNVNKKALVDSYKFDLSDFILMVEPFFFSLDKKMSYYWNVNGREVVGTNERGFKAGKIGKSSNIKIKIEHDVKLFQEAESELEANF